jgi:hypothetical protein
MLLSSDYPDILEWALVAQTNKIANTSCCKINDIRKKLEFTPRGSGSSCSVGCRAGWGQHGLRSMKRGT